MDVCSNVGYVQMQWEIYVKCGRHICSGAYISNIRCIYTSTPAHIIDCIEFI